MRTINIRDAKARLSQLIATREPFIIAKRGKPLAKVVPLDEPPKGQTSRLGFMKGLIKVPDDFDTMMADEIEEMFYGDPDK